MRKNKHDALVREVNLNEANPCFARIRLDDGREATVSLKDLAPCPPRSHSSKNLEIQLNPINEKDVAELHDCAGTDESSICESETLDIAPDHTSENSLRQPLLYEDQPGSTKAFPLNDMVIQLITKGEE